MSPNKKRVNEESDEYKVKRARNNEAVKKSREKSKQHAKETQDRVDKLKGENDKLRNNIRTVQKNLQTLKELFIDAANKKKDSIDENQIREILKEIDTMETLDLDNDSDSEEDSDGDESGDE